MWTFGASYHPQTQGAVEKFNDTIQRKIKKLCEFGKKPWDSGLGKAIDGYNKSFHRTLGCSPNEFLSGLIPKFGIDCKLLAEDFNWQMSPSKMQSIKK